MKIIHIAPLTLDKSAGLTYSIPSFVKAQNNLTGIESKILISINAKTRDHNYIYLDEFDTKKELTTFLSTFDIAIFHSTYIPSHIKLARLLRGLNIPYVIVPRGGFTKKAKNVKRVKKVIGDILLFNRFFNSPYSIHYLTHNEKENSVYSTKNDFVLPNGIDIPNDNEKKKKIVHNSSLLVTYIGRLDIYIKGLDVLLESIGLIRKKLLNMGIIIQLYGPIDEDSALKLNELINKYKIDDVVEINPPLYDNDKVEKLKETDVFIQTSRSEGLPMGVLEALSFGVPCILTPGTNMSAEVNKYNAGIEVELNPTSISNGLISMLDNHSLLSEMRNNARILAKQYSWIKIAKESINIYQEIIKGAVIK